MTAGGSVSRWGQEQRAAARKGLWRSLLAALGLSPAARRADARAADCDAGAIGEQRTAELLRPLQAAGWLVLHDRSIPGAARANADHVVVRRRVFLVDSKLWSARYPVHVVGGSLLHGRVNRDRAIRSLRFEADLVSRAVGIPVQPVIAMHNAPVAGDGFLFGEIPVVPAGRLVELLRANDGPGPGDAALAARVRQALPPYGTAA